MRAGFGPKNLLRAAGSWLRRLADWPAIKRFFAYYLGGLYDRLGRHHSFLLAGGLAFSVLICLLPLVFVLLAVLGTILGRPAVTGEINTFIDRLIPYQRQANFVKQIVYDRIVEFRQYRNLAGAIGVVGLILAASRLFASMRTILNLTFRAMATGTIITGKLRDLKLVGLVLLFFLTSITVLPSLDIVLGLAQKVPILKNLGFLPHLSTKLSTFAIMVAALYSMYYYIPQVKLPRKAALVSAFWATALWDIAEQLFGFYVTNLANMTRVYGAYTLLIAVVFWIYYSAVVFIVGAEIGQLYRERARIRSRAGG